MTEDLWNLFHRYNRLVRRQLVQPLKCDCGEVFVTTLGRDDKLILACFGCATETTPGVQIIDRVRAVVKEHFVDD